jgi:heme A synthase
MGLAFLFYFFLQFLSAAQAGGRAATHAYVDFPPRTFPTRWPTITMQHEAMMVGLLGQPHCGIAPLSFPFLF